MPAATEVGRLTSIAQGRFGELPLPVFGFAQSDHIPNEIAQMRLRVCCGERLAAHEYRFDDLLSQMPVAFQYGAKSFAARPFRTISKHARRVCRGCGASRNAIFRQTIRRVCRLRRRTLETPLEFEMAKRQFSRIAYGITAYSMIRHLLPAACGQTHVGPMQVRQKRAVFAWVPPKNVQRTRDSIGLGSVYWRTDCPRCRVALVESKYGADFVIDFQFTKIQRLFWPLYVPTYAADEIAFVKTVPCGRSNLDEQEPAKGRQHVPSRKL